MSSSNKSPAKPHDDLDAYPFMLPEEEWQRRLTTLQYSVLRAHGTERACSSPLNDEKRPGTYSCLGCGQVLFDTNAKYESGTGWPSFFQPINDEALQTQSDRGYGMIRTEVHCANCGCHMGHRFPDGPPPTGMRYCMNGIAMVFKPA